ncbi:hypothetical protein [Pseudalkalibacillus salsuginis]|uniref:hypothetical protein n=1 Tax=Pseudalkalibacillus salsuginis TaxID=2910972 RepID=UPI001F168D24|nr:hypothetical protein [Pseudalkalibacillus salsuginis]MCF6411964.1 hypothetical protein [Pseudalkalibacillus salsuginis]
MGNTIKRSLLLGLLAYIIFIPLNISWYLIIYEVYGYEGSLHVVQNGDLFFRNVVYLYQHKDIMAGTIVILTIIVAFFVQILRLKEHT